MTKRDIAPGASGTLRLAADALNRAAEAAEAVQRRGIMATLCLPPQAEKITDAVFAEIAAAESLISCSVRNKGGEE